MTGFGPGSVAVFALITAAGCGARTGLEVDAGPCTPRCEGRVCGSDGCGGTCAPGCEEHWTCDGETGQCRCEPGCGREGCEPGQWATICAGTFAMGPPGSQRQVTLTHHYIIQATEVTEGQFEDRVGFNDTGSSDCGRDCAMSLVAWQWAATYCNLLSEQEGLQPCYLCTASDYHDYDYTCRLDPGFATPYDCLGFRLPTAAEWELAARAGTTTDTYNGDLGEIDEECDLPNSVLDPIAWYCHMPAPYGVSGPFEVAALEPNAWGLYDMLGNVDEWSHDRLRDESSSPVTDPHGSEDDEYACLHGGCWMNGASVINAAYRHCAHRYSSPVRAANACVGFRPVRTLAPR